MLEMREIAGTRRTGELFERSAWAKDPLQRRGIMSPVG